MLQGPAFTSASILSRSFYLTGHRPTTSSTMASDLSSETSSAIANNSGGQQIKTRVRIVPSLENNARCVVFNVIDRELSPGTVLRIGRFTDRGNDENRITFKSKVVSRSHCELWVDMHGKLHIKDTKSSSGTFVNHVRLSAAGQTSTSHLLSDSDTVQLGVDYQGGVDEIFRAVRMKIEINRPIQSSAYSLATFQQLKTLDSTQQLGPLDSSQLDECCICLYAIAPRQALFLAPCSHHFHYKCIRPLLASHPGFQCPLCRSYADLDAPVEVDQPQVVPENNPSHMSRDVPVDPIPVPITRTPVESADGVAGATFVSDGEDEEVRPRDTTVEPDVDLLEEEEHDSIGELATSPTHTTLPIDQRRHSTSGLVDKLKMVIFDKRRLSVSGGKRRRSNYDEDERDSSNLEQQPIVGSPESSSSTTARMSASIPFFGA
ncbi:hypothetical protein INT43_000213 [Umbelopsis isabellina]|uniref:SMAD/FHA domain-containing protein n=1 Tax=Mortierella isabellina TaxID=91625 RepID=A0A8H7PFB7_MORIS|nr:hypothetical protein INT43_000213 [Umbelopsis isabellina]